MKHVWTLVLKATLCLVAIVLLATGAAIASLELWAMRKFDQLKSVSQVAQTAKGLVEYQSRGEGPAVLVLHGGFGGYDQGMLFVPELADAGFRVIAPSRPGYLRTPLSAGATNEEQADAMAALLDALGVQRAAVAGISAGGPVALQFALRHPDRTEALILLCAITHKTAPKLAERIPLARWGLHSRVLADLGSWCNEQVTRDTPQRAMAFTFKMFSLAPSVQRARLVDGVLADPVQRNLFVQLSNSTIPLGARLAGIRNDYLRVTELADVPFEQVRAPTLIVHGTADKEVRIDHAQLATARIPHATYRQLEGADHLLMLGPKREAMKTAITAFLRRTHARCY